MLHSDAKEQLDAFLDRYHTRAFIPVDPISIPHLFEKYADIEIAAFLTATIAWGKRKAILASARGMMTHLDGAPHDFLLNASEGELRNLRAHNIHRTFLGEDFAQLVSRLAHLYRAGSSLEQALLPLSDEVNYYAAIERFRAVMLAGQTQNRLSKHLSSPAKNSASKRMLMFLRWMVRRDRVGVDFGIWQRHDPGKLSIPLDVHSGNTARLFGILKTRQNNWKAVEELDTVVRSWNPADPAIYDFALFGYGVAERNLLQ